jgi:hypothetical protein
MNILLPISAIKKAPSGNDGFAQKVQNPTHGSWWMVQILSEWL